MAKIKSVKGRQVFDSRGNPTVEAEVILQDGSIGTSIVPSGASTGKHEAHELRDKNKDYLNKSVFNAVNNINHKICTALIDKDSSKQKKIDEILINLDGTENKSNIGANAILAASIATLKAAAKFSKKEIYEYLNKDNKPFCMPYPLMNIINGGAHANNSLEIQEFMIRPDGAKSFTQAIKMSFLVINNLKKILKKLKLSTSVGDEGGFAPMIGSNAQALNLITKAIQMSGFKNGKDISICLDVAANELFKKNKYSIHSKKYVSAHKSILEYKKLIKKFKIKSIEDPFAENDWKSWNKLMIALNKKIQIVGDDLYVTNLERLKVGFLNQSSNAILIKLNQIGTVTETIEVIKFAQNIGFNTIISHRSGESEDTFIADLAVGTNSNQIKSGSLCRSERVAKYNQILRIEESLGKKAKMNNL